MKKKQQQTKQNKQTNKQTNQETNKQTKAKQNKTKQNKTKKTHKNIGPISYVCPCELDHCLNLTCTYCKAVKIYLTM